MEAGLPRAYNDSGPKVGSGDLARVEVAMIAFEWKDHPEDDQDTKKGPAPVKPAKSVKSGDWVPGMDDRRVRDDGRSKLDDWREPGKPEGEAHR